MRITLVIAALSGGAAMMHQVLWTRRLLDLLGAGHEAVARVFGCFFLGLAIGACLAAWARPRAVRPWRWIAVAELAVAFGSVPAMVLPAWTGWIWPALGPDALAGPAGAFTKLMLSIAVVLPPATAMGMVLPFLAAVALRGGASLDRMGVWLYALNTAAGIAGLSVVALALLPAAGALGSMGIAAALNLLASMIAWRADARDSDASPKAPVGPPRADGHARAMLTAFGSGFAFLTLEVAALRLLTLDVAVSFHVPAALLSAVLLLLALGAALVPLWIRARGAAGALVHAALCASALGVATMPLLFQRVRESMQAWTAPESFSGWYGELLLATLLSIGPAVLPAAIVFPATFAWMGGPARDPTGRRWGWLLALNGVGGWLGAELAYRWWIPAFGPHVTAACAGLVYAGLAFAWARSAGRRWVSAVVFGLAAWVGVRVVPGLPLIEPSGRFAIVEQRSGREGVVAVVDVAGGGRSMLFGSTYVLGGTELRGEQERMAHWPLLAHPAPRRVALIGLATGGTAAGARRHAPVERLDIVEISPLVVDLARRHFAAFHPGLFDDPRIRIHVEDGRTWIAASRRAYDVIIGDLFLPWGAGEARLYSLEHFRAAREALAEGGLFCQWLAMYQLTPDQFEVIAATFQRVFPETVLVLNDLGPFPALGLIGYRDREWDWMVIERRLEEARAEGFADPLMKTPYGLRVLHLGALDPLDGRRLNTLNNMRIELDAGRLFAYADPAHTYLFGRRWLDWLDTIPLRAHEERARP